MNVEIVKELVRVWRNRAKPEPMNVEAYAMDRAEDQISVSLHEKKAEELRAKVLEECAQDLEDVIRIYNEFKYKK